MKEEELKVKREIAVMRIHSKMFPSISLKEEVSLERLLKVFESHEKFEPNKWGNWERARLDYNKSEIINLANLDKIDEVYLHRKSLIKYSGSFDLNWSSRSYLDFEMNKSTSQKYWSTFFEIFDRVAEIVKPRYGLTHITWDVVRPWTNEHERLKDWMAYASNPAPVDYPHGPCGLGIRTYFGGDILELFDREIFKTIPAIVTEMEWGGIRIDLVDKPWEADPELLFERWLDAMKHLEPAQVFAIPQFDEENGRWIRFSANKVWKEYLERK